jgi:hypothetical protein
MKQTKRNFWPCLDTARGGRTSCSYTEALNCLYVKISTIKSLTPLIFSSMNPSTDTHGTHRLTTHIHSYMRAHVFASTHTQTHAHAQHRQTYALTYVCTQCTHSQPKHTTSHLHRGQRFPTYQDAASSSHAAQTICIHRSAAFARKAEQPDLPVVPIAFTRCYLMLT